MSVTPRPVIKTGAGADLAFAVVLLASYFTTFTALKTATTIEILLLIGLGIAYVSIGIYGYAFCARSESLALHLVYFALQIPLGAWIVYLAKGGGFNALILLPLAGHSVMLLNRNRLVMLVNLVILLAYSISSALFSTDLSSIFGQLSTFLAGQVFIVAFTQMAVNEERARLEVERLISELGSAYQRLREYAVQVEELAVVRERNRLAREIHDGLGHYLTTIHMQIQAARAVMDTDRDRAVEVLSAAQGLTQEALTDIRRSVAALRAAPEEALPLSDRLQHLLKSFQMGGISVDFQLLGSPRQLSPQAHLTLYRTAQEGLSNVTKHSGASHAWLTLDFSAPHCVRISVRDNGRGAEQVDGGFGLLGLKERATLLEGSFRTHSTTGQGFELVVEVPE
jgi:signal transduction histidine kinase